MSIPTSADEISVDWLAAALSDSLPGIPIRSVEVVDWNAGTTGRARLRIGYGAGEAGPSSMFIKLPPADELQKMMVQVTGMGRREVLFYTHLAGEVPVRCPRPYYAAANADGSEYLMLLEDLAASDCDFPTLHGGCTADYARRVVAELARLHARYWNSPRFTGDLDWIDPPMRHEIGPQLVGQALGQHGAEMPEEFRAMARLYIDRTDAICDLWEQGVPTLCHGDCHIGNHFVTAGSPGFLDWACVYRCPGMRDVSYFFTNSVPTDLRRSEERDLVQRYRDALEAAGVAPPPPDELWLQYRRHAAYSWVAAVTTFSMGDKWQPLHVGREAVRRANAALADLRTVEALREGL